jgi:RNA polymerase sigma-70 factor, ECF subfamily
MAQNPFLITLEMTYAYIAVEFPHPEGAPPVMDYSKMTVEEILHACVQARNTAAWEEFVRRFHRVIAIVALRTAQRWGESSLQVIDGLVQDTYLKLCADNLRLLQTFNPTHEAAFYGYIKVMTANLVHDHFKAARTLRRNANCESLTPDFVAECPHSGQRSDRNSGEHNILLHEIDVCLRTIPSGANAERDRRIFWLYYRVGLSARAIAELPSVGLTTKGVESTLVRMTQHVRECFAQKTVRDAVSGKTAEETPSAESLH